MTSQTTIAQAAANSHPELGEALHLISMTRGRLDLFEQAVASRDRRSMIRAHSEIVEFLSECAGIVLRVGR